MGDVVDLAAYRAEREAKAEAATQEEIKYLQRVLAEIVASMPDTEEEPFFVSLTEHIDTLAPFLTETNLDGYPSETE
jgi:hypothetical protein